MITTIAHVKKALEHVLNKPYTSNDIMVLLMVFQSYVNAMDTWENVETMIEEVVGDLPEWHECKKMVREL